MNAGKKGKGSGRSDPARNKLFGAFWHVHNPFSVSSYGDHDSDDYRQDESIGNLKTMRLEVEMTKAEAFLTARNLISRMQKS